MRPMRFAPAVTALALLASPLAAAQAPEAKTAFEEGRQFKNAKDNTAALGAFERATQIDPNYAAAWTEVGNTHLALGKLPEAIPAFERALQLNPADQTARYNLAYVLRQQGRFDDAARQYQLYLTRSPDDADAHYGLAESLKAAGAHLAAAEAFETYARTEKRATWKKWIAKAKTEAVELRKKAQATPPTAPAAPPPAVAAPPPAIVAAAAPPPAAAATEAPKARPAPPTPTNAPKAALHLSFSGEAPATPSADITAPANATPAPAAPAAQRPQAFDAGLTHLRAGDYSAALVRLRVAEQESPDDVFIVAAIGSAYLGLLDGDQAADAYQRALRTASGPAVAGLYLGLGEAQRLRGEDGAARTAYQRAAEHEAAPQDIKKICEARLASIGG